MQVTIQLCYGEHTTWTSSHQTDDRHTALERAIAKHFGKGKGFYRDSGLSSADAWYGQIGHRLKGQNCSSMDTGRVCVRFD